MHTALILAVLFFMLQPSRNSIPESQSVKPHRITNLTKQFDENQNKRRLLEPEKRSKFNANWGYEPYWADGNIYLDQVKNESSPVPQEGALCGDTCPQMYITYGVVCGRNSNMTHKTFKNYCELVTQDCTNRMKWTIVYRGECQQPLKTYPSHDYLNEDVDKRAPKYIEEFHQRITTTDKHWKDIAHLFNRPRNPRKY